MKARMRINVIIAGVSHPLDAEAREYRSLMELIADRLFPNDFGECKGIGRCGTCHVRILNGPQNLLEKAGNESSTLSKITNTDRSSRLACQIRVDESIDGLSVEIITEDEGLPGEFHVPG